MKRKRDSHVKCSDCGGIIGRHERGGFMCETCGKEIELYCVDYDYIAINPKTGWCFPMKKSVSDEDA